MAYNFTPFKQRLAEIEEWLGREFGSLRTGRATPALLDGVMVESYGTMMPLKQVGAIGIEDPRSLRISLWDKSQIRSVESAIQAANLGVSVTTSTDGVRVVFPELTTEKRKVLQKLAGEKVEEARISIRKERERVWNDVQERERAGELSEDEKFRLKDELQKLVDSANERLGEMAKRKEVEINN